MKIKIINQKKFIRSIIILLVILLLALLGIKKTYSKTEITYREDYIVKGDTLWSIAEKEIEKNDYYKNKDIREVMYELKELNQIKNGDLTIGQKIRIPNL